MIQPTRILPVALCLLVSLPLASKAAPFPNQVRVRLFEAHAPVRQVKLSGSFRLNGESAPRQRTITLINRNGQLSEFGPHLKLRGTVYLEASPQGERNIRRTYTGELEATACRGNAICLDNTISPRIYVATVTGSESQPDWPMEALKAQAVLTQSRLHTLWLKQRPKVAQYEVGDSTQGEAFLGEAYRRPTVQRATDAVWGQILITRQPPGKPILPFYHAACGGHTADGRYFTGGASNPAPYITAVPCPHCRTSPFGKWQAHPVPPAEKAIKVLRDDGHGRPLTVERDGKEMGGYDYWLALGKRYGWGMVPGTRYRIRGKTIQSIGAGHGLGLCQWGAATLARQGKTYRQILSYYFPTLTLSPP